MPVLNAESLFNLLVQHTRTLHADAKCPYASLGLSGGIDSAVTAAILTEALGPDKVVIAHLGIDSNPIQTRRAEALATGLGLRFANVDLTDACAVTLDAIYTALRKAGYDLDTLMARASEKPTIHGGFRSCFRAPVLDFLAKVVGDGLVQGTGNMCEDLFLRYYQKRGDGAVDVNILANLSKGEVYQLAWYLKDRFPGARQAYIDTIAAVPSADLWAGVEQSDEGEMAQWLGVPFTYTKMDPNTGKVVSVGTIERVSMTLRQPYPSTMQMSVGDVLFTRTSLDDAVWDSLVESARQRPAVAFPADEFTDTEVRAFLEAARHAERVTHHKMNPNCPSGPSRNWMVNAGILSDTLSDYFI